MRAEEEFILDPRRFNVFQIWEILILEQWLRRTSAARAAAA